MIGNCQICGKVFNFTPNRKKTAKFCSHKCYGVAIIGRDRVGEDILCDLCGKVFYRKKSNIKDKNYCSAICRQVAVGKMLSGRKKPIGFGIKISIALTGRKNFKNRGLNHWNWKCFLSRKRGKYSN